MKDGIIGDFPSLMLRHGAAGYEIDRADVALGTPSQALMLATATGFSDSYQHVVEEILSTDNERGGTTNPPRPCRYRLFRRTSRGSGFLGRIHRLVWGTFI